MCMCMYGDVYVLCVFVCLWVCVWCVCMFVYMCVNLGMCAYACMCDYVPACICVFARVRVSVSLSSVCTFVVCVRDCDLCV